MILYQVHSGETRCTIEKASPKRKWMDETSDTYAYRCLPLTIANMLGYHVFSKSVVKASWDGGSSISSVVVEKDSFGTACSIFGHGILTFHIDWLIVTEENTNLYITGPLNHVVPNVQALTGIYETDWAPFSFTMNWQFLNPGTVTFNTDDPICHFFPIPRGFIETQQITMKHLSENKELSEEFNRFDKSRSKFIASKASGWQKNYFKGLYSDGRQCPISNHQTKINLPNIDQDDIRQ